MNTFKEALLLSEGKSTWERKLAEGIVDNETFIHFITGTVEGYERGGKEFASTLDLEVFTPYFTRLIESDKHDYIVSEEKRRIYDQAASRFPNNLFYQRDKENYYRKASIERAVILYINLEDVTLRSSEVVFGDWRSVKINTAQFKTDNTHPILNVHTHPSDSIFSPQDFSRIITKYYKSGHRLSSAEVILCPTMALLALPTIATPLVDQKTFIELRDSTIVEDHRTKQINQELVEVNGVGLGLALNNDNKTPEELWELRQVLLSKKNSRVNYNNNLQGIQFARDMNIQLYASTDLRQFKSFSA